MTAFLLISTFFAATSQGATMLGVYLDPPTTAGGGSTSTRAGVGSFHLYAVDTANQGIANYSITLGASVTAFNNRSPVSSIQDANGDSQTAGFSLLRSNSNVNPVVASQNLAGQTPYLIKGFGVSAGSFAAISAADPGSSVTGPTTSASWGGNYENGALGVGPGGRAWVLLAEGLYNGNAGNTPVFSIVTAANILVYGSAAAGDFSQLQTTTTFDSGGTVFIDNVNASDPGVVTRNLSNLYTGPPPNQFHFLGYKSPAGVSGGGGSIHPATLDLSTKEFRWDTTGAMLGEYSWHSAYLDANQAWNPHIDITVRITAVPEPTILSLFTISIAGIFSATRHRRA